MDEYLKIDDAEFEQMLEDARKVLETMSPEKIANLRALCNDELGIVTRVLETDIRKCKEISADLEKDHRDYSKENPLKQAKKKYWLGQLANFLLSFFCKVPREFTPSYAYPFGSSKKFAEFSQSIDDKLTSLVYLGKVLSEYSCNGLYEIKRNIKNDDARLIVFCHSCKNIYAAFTKVDVSVPFRQVASLLYQNNVSFPVSIYRTDVTQRHITDGVSSMVEKVKNSFSDAKGNEA